MFAREAQPRMPCDETQAAAWPGPCARVSNDNGVRSPRRQRPAPGGIVAVAAEIAGGIALRYIADGVFKISRLDGVSA